MTHIIPKQKSFITHGIVLKRSNIGETDRVVTLLTQNQGKIAVIAKGVRSLASSKRAALEPGNYVKVFLISGSSMHILTQAQIIEDCSVIRHDLQRIKHLTQLLEILFHIFVEEELNDETFHLVLSLRKRVLQENFSVTKLKKELSSLLENLGFQSLEKSGYTTISDYIASLTNQSLRSYSYLTLKSIHK